MIEKAHGIMFHHFHNDGIHIKGQGSIDKDQFRKMILWLQKRYNLLSANEWYSKALEDTLQDKDICLTFDDSLQCQYDIALPVLEEFNITAFWFIYTSPLEGIHERLEIYRYFRFSEFRSVNDFYECFNAAVSNSRYNQLVKDGLRTYNSSEFLKESPFYTEEDKVFRFIRDHILGVDSYYEIMDKMVSDSEMDIENVGKNLWIDKEGVSYLHKNGHMIGLHSHSHPTQMKHLSYDDQLEEYKNCRTILSSIVDHEIKTMSHPCNSYNLDTLKVLKNLDVDLGFRANMEEGYSSAFEYPRLDHTYLIEKI